MNDIAEEDYKEMSDWLKEASRRRLEVREVSCIREVKILETDFPEAQIVNVVSGEIEWMKKEDNG